MIVLSIDLNSSILEDREILNSSLNQVHNHYEK